MKPLFNKSYSPSPYQGEGDKGDRVVKIKLGGGDNKYRKGGDF